jgi:hypothetical protein
MRHPAALTATLLVSGLVACGAPTSDVADLSVVTVLPKEVGAGGYRSTLETDGIATGFFYQAAIADCGSEVLDAALEWAGRHQFSDDGGEVEERRATLRLSSGALPRSAFVIRYSLSSDHGLARVRITHEAGADGAAPTSQDLLAVGLQELVEAQLAAARCGTDG